MASRLNLSQAAEDAVYRASLDAGMDKDEARDRGKAARHQVVADVAAEDPVRAAFAHAHRMMRVSMSEARRLRAERDALLRALAHAMGTTESTALAIARLDMEQAEKAHDFPS